MTKGKGKDPGVGGMKKHLNLKDHKERQQPKARRHLGTLEKHKDYAERAKMHHVKEGKIKVLRKKAAEKNPEEFYFGMVNGRADDKGAHMANATKKKTTTEQHASNSQDVRFLEWRRQQLQREVAKKAESVDCGFRTREHTHTRFVYDGDVEVPRPPLRDVALVSAESTDAPEDLLQRMDYKTRLDTAVEGLRLEQHLISKGRRRLVTVAGGQQVYRWSTQRKRS